MTDDYSRQLAGLQRAMAAPLPTPEELAAWSAADKAMAARIHRARPGVPLHHVYAVLETLRVVQRVDAAREESDDERTELTRGELQDLVDSMGIDLYHTSDKLDFIREMCDMHDASGRPVTTTDVRGWLGYTGCGGVLVLPDETVARLATMSADSADKAVASGDAADIAGEQP